MRTVNEVSQLTGISIRALHHYDTIDLLKPTKITEAGYRLYDDAALDRLLHILLFRELQVPLKEIKSILDSPGFDPNEALEQQIRLLELQLKHTKELISFARNIQKGGVNSMDFHAFDKTETEQYLKEVKEKWGSTKTYAEYEKNIKKKTKQELDAAASRLMALFAELGTLRQLPPEEQKVQEKIGELQTLITENYYQCTEEILKGLGQLYVSDERMKHNIDKAGGNGTADFVRQAIEIYCSRELSV